MKECKPPALPAMFHVFQKNTEHYVQKKGIYFLKRLSENAAASIFHSLFTSVYTYLSYWLFSAAVLWSHQDT